MASPAQIQANHRNALRSTGPRSDEGKAASRFNALKHGLEADSLVIPGEDPAELEALALDYQRQFDPQGPQERFLVEAIVSADWNLRRYRRLEAQIYRALADPPDSEAPALTGPAAAFLAGGPQARAFETVLRRLSAAERAWYKAIGELRRIQAERTPDPLLDLSALASLAGANLPPAALAPRCAAPIGFVPAVSAHASRGSGAAELGSIQSMVVEHQAELLEAWHGYFGPRS
jgi:hypothetical protein